MLSEIFSTSSSIQGTGCYCVIRYWQRQDGFHKTNLNKRLSGLVDTDLATRCTPYCEPGTTTTKSCMMLKVITIFSSQEQKKSMCNNTEAKKDARARMDRQKGKLLCRAVRWLPLTASNRWRGCTSLGPQPWGHYLCHREVDRWFRTKLEADALVAMRWGSAGWWFSWEVHRNILGMGELVGVGVGWCCRSKPGR